MLGFITRRKCVSLLLKFVIDYPVKITTRVKIAFKLDKFRRMYARKHYGISGVNTKVHTCEHISKKLPHRTPKLYSY